MLGFGKSKKKSETQDLRERVEELTFALSRLRTGDVSVRLPPSDVLQVTSQLMQIITDWSEGKKVAGVFVEGDYRYRVEINEDEMVVRRKGMR